MSDSSADWTQAEKELARAAFDKAYEREIAALIQQVRGQANEVEELDHVWKLHDYLSTKRHDVDGKYDYRYSVLLFVFAQLVKEGWLELDELQGLAKEKLSKIKVLMLM